MAELGWFWFGAWCFQFSYWFIRELTRPEGSPVEKEKEPHKWSDTGTRMDYVPPNPVLVCPMHGVLCTSCKLGSYIPYEKLSAEQKTSLRLNWEFLRSRDAT